MAIRRSGVRALSVPLALLTAFACAAPEPSPSPTPSPTPTPLTIGTAERPIVLLLLPSAEPERALALGQELVTVLEQASDLRWEVDLPRSEAESLEDLCGQLADAAFLGQLGALLAVSGNCATPELALVRPGPDGDTATFRRELVVRDDGPDTLSALRGGAVAYGDPRRSAGTLAVALAIWRELRIDPLTFFERSLALGDDDAALEALASGDVDAAAVAPGSAREGQRVLATTPGLPNEAFAVRIGVPDELVRAMRDALLAAADSERGQAALEGLYGAAGLAPVEPAAYEPLREAATLADVDLAVEVARTPLPARR